MSFKSWIEKNQGAWEFIKFMVLSNISTITRIVLTAVGTAIFVDALRMTEPFQFLIFDYRDTGVGAFVTFLIAEVMAQVVNFFVQMKLVFKSDASYRETAWKYAVLAVVIVVAGVSLVYNSFAISVAERTRMFGLLSSLGASKRQLRRSVLTEALLLAVVGIPVGLALGLLGCMIVFHFTGAGLASMFDVDTYGLTVRVVVSPTALALSAALALVTVLVSAWVPAIRASRVSAVDAIRQTKDVRLTRHTRRQLARANRRSKHAGGSVDTRFRGIAARLFGIPGFIAHRNLSRATSKGRVTVAALAISVALLIVAGIIGNTLGYASGTALNSDNLLTREKFTDVISDASAIDMTNAVSGVSASTYQDTYFVEFTMTQTVDLEAGHTYEILFDTEKGNYFPDMNMDWVSLEKV